MAILVTVYQSNDNAAYYSHVAFIHRLAMDGAPERMPLPMFFFGASHEEAKERAETWWRTETAKAAKAKADGLARVERLKKNAGRKWKPQTQEGPYGETSE